MDACPGPTDRTCSILSRHGPSMHHSNGPQTAAGSQSSSGSPQPGSPPSDGPTEAETAGSGLRVRDTSATLSCFAESDRHCGCHINIQLLVLVPQRSGLVPQRSVLGWHEKLFRRPPFSPNGMTGCIGGKLPEDHQCGREGSAARRRHRPLSGEPRHQPLCRHRSSALGATRQGRSACRSCACIPLATMAHLCRLYYVLCTENIKMVAEQDTVLSGAAVLPRVVHRNGEHRNGERHCNLRRARSGFCGRRSAAASGR